MLTSLQVEEFRENGFLVVKQLIPMELRPDLSSALERVISKVNENPSLYRTRYTKNEAGSKDTWGVGDIFHPDLFESSFAEYLGDERLLSSIASILGKDMRFWGGHALWSPQEVGYDLLWHRDGKSYLYNPTGYTTHVQFNSALTEDHCFIAVPGSHRRPLHAEELEQVSSGGTAELPGQVVAMCEPGDVLFMNAWTLHRGKSPAGGGRRTLHFNLQPRNEWYGGQSSRAWMRDEAYMSRFHPNVRRLITNLLEWDENHPMVKDETGGQ